RLLAAVGCPPSAATAESAHGAERTPAATATAFLGVNENPKAQNPNPKSQQEDPNSRDWDLELRIWDFGFAESHYALLSVPRFLLAERVVVAAGLAVLVVLLTDVFHQLVARRLQPCVERDRKWLRVVRRIFDRHGVHERSHVRPCPALGRVQLLAV